MYKELFQLKTRENSVKEFSDAIHQGIPSVVFGVSGAFKSYMVSCLDNRVLYVVKDNVEARQVAKEIAEFSDKKVVFIPPKDDSLFIAKAFSKDTTYARIIAFDQLKTADVVVVTPQTVMQNCPKEVPSLTIIRDYDIDLDYVVKSLIMFGYKRVEVVEDKGTFAVRGDVLDFFPINMDNPVRADFFGDTVEGIKKFDKETRSNLGGLDRVKILPAVEYVFNAEDAKTFNDLLRKEVNGTKAKDKARLRRVVDEVKQAVDTLDGDILGLFAKSSDKACCIFDLLNDDTAIIFNEVKLIKSTAELLEREFNDRFASLYASGEVFSFMKDNTFTFADFLERAKKFREGAVQTLSSSIPFFNPLKIINPKVSGVANYQLAVSEAYNDIKNWLFSGYTVLISAGDIAKAERFGLDLSNNNIASIIDSHKFKGVVITTQSISQGFVFHEEKVALIGKSNLFIKSHSAKRPTSKKKAFFNAPGAGDYCVHETHGIGKVLGNRKIETSDGIKDYVSVEYAGGDILHVPVEQMDVLTRYLGGEKHPRLSKIGGKDFDRIKRTVKESIKKMSFDIKRLYKERKELRGFEFSEDGYLQQAFIDAFPFEETADQLAVDSEIKEDMVSGRVMDRLVCGDVGFGKTEVALRAVFRTIVNGKQAVMLAPTTILTEQHYNTAVERFKPFGVRVACLNRFRTKKQQEQIVEKIKKGEIDFIIGTHRLLSKDIGFFDLGLLVLDEEQRFGVEHKEKIKLIKKNVNTLTLTATPIPRTLHMSLSGIRDISAINTPPKSRLPVQTYVCEQTDALLKDAIERELNRGGQVFLLYNRVETIEKFSAYVSELVPKAKLTVAHGQMDERTLEKRIMEFYKGESDVLVSTTIIENGIDLPRANTLVVIDADTLGLSTLYQLKGRVGRSDKLAYAYFTFRGEKVLSSTAHERLTAITDFTEMGSGIKIAMRDLEIRGAGNILGAEQHGHMDKIGYELYSKLLREEISGEEENAPELDIRVSAFIPESYIESCVSRMDAYKEIAELTDKKGEKELCEYLIDTYGEIPSSVINLINIAMAKRLAMKLGVCDIIIDKNRACIAFNDFKAFSIPSLGEAIEDTVGIKISNSDKAYVEFNNYGISNEDSLRLIRKFLELATGDK